MQYDTAEVQTMENSTSIFLPVNESVLLMIYSYSLCYMLKTMIMSSKRKFKRRKN